ncbi:glycogen synthase GlgA [Pararobbsia silviterrae]|uniref:Glycogen synthase n=1 Tax=Pararobbsia silviterrae TaxID=1792498 RepID=A0A494YC25_9BURK|nr:glycogen synthase GlgA [Pararobbsia silviterrae]RKP57514.1 glycogen synthase GlgA [Pararobbsia silviterrae]
MSLRVLLVTSEAMPLAKTGGLADMVSAYAAAARDAGVEATILMPGYPCAFARAKGVTRVCALPGLPGGDGALYRARMPDSNAPVLLLQHDALYARTGFYQDEHGNDYADNALRFAALSHAAVRIASGVRGVARPDVVHAHDWHAGLVPLLIAQARNAGTTQARSVFTIHNLAFQGNYPMWMAGQLGIPDHVLGVDGIEFYGELSFMKAGIQFADRVTTVSDTYAREILTERFGHRMEGVVAANRHKLAGITNGIDMEMWNPAGDPMIPASYSNEDMRGKHLCKRGLQQLFGLPNDPFAPIVAMGSRLTTQKMADLAIESIPMLLERYPRLQFAILGQGDHGIEAALRHLAQQWPDRIGLYIGFDEQRAHMLHAGADILLHGSRFEPCGLAQIYAMRYGTIPVASRVGGLADTIVDCRDPGDAINPMLIRVDGVRTLGETLSRLAPAPTGFLFDGESRYAMAAAVARALDAFVRPALWRELQRNAMRGDHGWARPVAQYVAVYATLTTVKPARHAPPAAPRTAPARSKSAPAPRVAAARTAQPENADVVFAQTA